MAAYGEIRMAAVSPAAHRRRPAVPGLDRGLEFSNRAPDCPALEGAPQCAVHNLLKLHLAGGMALIEAI